MIDSLKRRSRMKRQPSGKRVVLSQRDFEIFQLLFRYPLLDSRDLTRFLRPKSTKRIIERLGLLFHETGYLDRPSQQWEHAKALQVPLVYALTNSGLDILFEHQSFPHRAILTEARQIGYRIPQFRHLLMTCKAVAKIERSNQADQTKRFVPVEEILQRRKSPATGRPALAFPVTIPRNVILNSEAHRTHIIPDALYGVEYAIENTEGVNKQYRFFAVETERTTPLKRRSLQFSSTYKKILAYQAALHSASYRQTLGIPNLFPSFVARDQSHCDQIRQLAEEILSTEELNLFRFLIAE